MGVSRDMEVAEPRAGWAAGPGSLLYRYGRCSKALAAVPFVCGCFSWILGRASSRRVRQVTTRDVGCNRQVLGEGLQQLASAGALRAIWRQRPWIDWTPFVCLPPLEVRRRRLPWAVGLWIFRSGCSSVPAGLPARPP